MTVYRCKVCKYETTRKFNYEKHVLTNKHLKNKLICFKCAKQYNSQYAYNVHMQSKTCTNPDVQAEAEARAAAEAQSEAAQDQQPQAPQTIIINNINNINNITNNDNTINNNLFYLDPRTMKGDLYKQACILMSPNTKELMHDDNIKHCRNLIATKIISDFQALDVLDSVSYTAEDALLLEDSSTRYATQSKYKPITKSVNSLRSVGIDLIPWCEMCNAQSPKVWFNPSLLTDEDLSLMHTLDADREYNNRQIDAYVVKVIAKAIVDTYLSRDNPRGQSVFCETRLDIFYKDSRNGMPLNYLTRLTTETMDLLLTEIFTVNSIIFKHLNEYHVKSKCVNIDYMFIYNTISDAFYDIVGPELLEAAA